MVAFAILIVLLSLQFAFAAPLKISRSEALEARGEDRPTISDSTLHSFVHVNGHHHHHAKHQEPLETRQFLEAAEIGYKIATNPTVDKIAAAAGKEVLKVAPKAVHAVEGVAKNAAKKFGSFFGGLFGHHHKSAPKPKAAPPKAKAAPKPPALKQAPKASANKATAHKAAGPKAAPKAASKSSGKKH